MMKTKTYRAPDRPAAVRLIRDDLGPDAIILQEKLVRAGLLGLFGKPVVEVLAAIDDSAPPPRPAAGRGVDARTSGTGRGAASEAPPRSIRGRPVQPAGLSDAGASKLAAILETFPKTGQPVPPAMAASLADLIARATAGEGAPATPSGVPAAAGAARPAGAAIPALPAGDAAAHNSPAGQAGANGVAHGERRDAGDGLGAVQSTLRDLQATVYRLTQQSQDSQLPREAPVVRIAYQELIQQELDPGLAIELAGCLSEEVGHDVYVDRARVERRLVELLEERLTASSLALPPHFEYIARHGSPAVAVLVGPTGVGKTTTLAKLASHFAFTEGKKVALVTTDTYRIAAAAQLGTYADILELPLEIVYQPEEIGAAIDRHAGADLVLVDTPGCGQGDAAKLGELAGFVAAASAAVPAATVLLTVAAPVKLRDLLHVYEGFGQIPIDGLIVTKLDETKAYGPVVSFISRTRRPVFFVATGQRVPNDIEPATVARLARLVVHGLQDETAEAGHVAAGERVGPPS